MGKDARKLFSYIFLFWGCAIYAQCVADMGRSFEIITPEKKAAIVYDKAGTGLDSISANLLAGDIEKVSGYRPRVSSDLKDVSGNVIFIGNANSALMKETFHDSVFRRTLQGSWERYVLKVLEHPLPKINKALIIAGSDARGTAYGVFSISERIGVSPWAWWADAVPNKKGELVLKQKFYISKAPAVKYRGIFLNDEDWGLQPWAAHTFEPETGDIGPKTYSRIFELLLRLRANTIWPAMHPSTRAFFHYKGNPEMARLYDIVVGSSHAEPMLRNNVDEWDEATIGDFNYFTNRQRVYKYWEERVKESRNMNAIYTIGMRGVHDSGMEGAKNTEQAVEILQKVITDQRTLLKQYREEPLDQVPQVFTLYKEVLDLYHHGLQIPDDVTLMWTDDNYGYIRQLSNAEERRREGGGGVYYHASYWGRPHDYLWLSSTNPALIREEMMKAHDTGSRRIWILNVGDIKPAEYNLQLFMDLANDPEKFRQPEYLTTHMQQFYSSIFGDSLGVRLAKIKHQYYDLAFVRKPEFMGWSQTEPTTPVSTAAFKIGSWGDENQRRLEAYGNLLKRTRELQAQISDDLQDSFFELIYYPVAGSALMNRKFLYRDRALFYSEKGALVANDYARRSHEAYQEIKDLTHQYNFEVANGKWKGMMDMKPRNLPVYEDPEIDLTKEELETGAGVVIEKDLAGAENEGMALPVFYESDTTTHFMDVFLRKEKNINWTIEKPAPWLKLDKEQGKLDDTNLLDRIEVAIDWRKWRAAGSPGEAELILSLDSVKKQVKLKMEAADFSVPKGTFIMKNGIMTIYAEDYSGLKNKSSRSWKRVKGLGHSGNIMEALPLTAPSITEDITERSPYLQYDLYLKEAGQNVSLVINALPTHPVSDQHKVRVGVQWDNDPISVLDFTTYGRSSKWKQNVLKNMAEVSQPLGRIEKGKHRLRLFLVDPGVLLDMISLKIEGYEVPYSIPSETME